jgi:hypothetical protein
MNKQKHTTGERANKLCMICKEERGHIVTSVSISGQITRVSCPKCKTVSTFKLSSRTSLPTFAQTPSPYDQARIYRTGQVMMHTSFGIGEVTAVIEPRKIDVLFDDRVRRLIHAQAR